MLESKKLASPANTTNDDSLGAKKKKGPLSPISRVKGSGIVQEESATDPSHMKMVGGEVVMKIKVLIKMGGFKAPKANEDDGGSSKTISHDGK